ncbi:hypothetical protein ACFQ1E_05195 [Sphingomonas canadensis]|uniref:Uncharacterized protein n=1 Tax=Sphingomonas canadensis TaxID=1219257 RepID=A0ABW3H2X7_9SPHN|nr:hypothetical protein [Sphingomonas canadensis]MCW3835815.1 hypothetical protein [Sphingomonas canadensis]
MAVTRMKGLGWLVCCMIVAPVCSFATSYGSAERTRLASVDAKIRTAEKEILALETEFAARASQLQLEEWNGTALGLAAPQAAQYVTSEAQLASLGQPAVAGEDAPRRELAAAVVPASVRTAMAATSPAIVTADAGSSRQAVAAAGARRGGEVVKVRQVAMLDNNTLEDLKRLAAAEAQKLR